MDAIPPTKHKRKKEEEEKKDAIQPTTSMTTPIHIRFKGKYNLPMWLDHKTWNLPEFSLEHNLCGQVQGTMMH